MSGGHLILVDASAYVWRAFHAIPMVGRRRDGLPVNAVKGFCRTLLSFVAEMQPRPTHFGIVFDHPTSREHRAQIFPEYKKNRKPIPHDIKPQMALCRAATRAFGFACIDQRGHEADDIIASYAREFVVQGGSAVIVSGDKDFMQLVDPPAARLFDPFHRNSLGIVGRWVDPFIVEERFGVPPEKVCEVMALMGDPVDNIPGVNGVGPKTAAKLVREHGTAEAWAKWFNSVAGAGNPAQLLESVRLSRRLVELDRHVELSTPIEELTYFETEPAELIPFLKATELYSVARKACDRFGVNIDDYGEASDFARPWPGYGNDGPDEGETAFA